jgi:hypothetical protein
MIDGTWKRSTATQRCASNAHDERILTPCSYGSITHSQIADRWLPCGVREG